MNMSMNSEQLLNDTLSKCAFNENIFVACFTILITLSQKEI